MRALGSAVDTPITATTAWRPACACASKLRTNFNCCPLPACAAKTMTARPPCWNRNTAGIRSAVPGCSPWQPDLQPPGGVRRAVCGHPLILPALYLPTVYLQYGPGLDVLRLTAPGRALKTRDDLACRSLEQYGVIQRRTGRKRRSRRPRPCDEDTCRHADKDTFSTPDISRLW